MSHTPFMQLYVADYLGDTQHLTTEQHGAYLLILMTMWRNGGVLPNDKSKLARIARVTPKRWHLICDDVMEFFDIEDDIITQKRLVEEYQKAVSKSEKRKLSGSLGGRAKSLKNNNIGLANATDLPKHSSEPDTRYIKKDTNVSPKKGCRLPEDFEPDYSIAITEGFSQQEAQRLFENFKDYWNAKAGKDGTKLDWQATWRRWVRSPYSQKFKGDNHASTSNQQKPFGQRVAEQMRNLAHGRNFETSARTNDERLSNVFSSGQETNSRTDSQNSDDSFKGTTLTLVASNS